MTLDGELVTREWLVQPPGNRYDGVNTEVHGLTAEDTEDAPTFPEVWAEAAELVTLDRTLAHNAEFDIDCVRAAMRHHKQKEPSFEPVGCTLRMAHVVWPTRTKPYRLDVLCAEYGIAIDAHKAGSDAAATLALADVIVSEWDDQGDIEELRAASNRGWQRRSESAMKRVARNSVTPPSTKQVNFLRSLLSECGVPDSSLIASEVKTGSEASILIDACLYAKRSGDDGDLRRELRKIRGSEVRRRRAFRRPRPEVATGPVEERRQRRSLLNWLFGIGD